MTKVNVFEKKLKDQRVKAMGEIWKPYHVRIKSYDQDNKVKLQGQRS
jgi:hypothetical protein